MTEQITSRTSDAEDVRRTDEHVEDARPDRGPG